MAALDKGFLFMTIANLPPSHDLSQDRSRASSHLPGVSKAPGLFRRGSVSKAVLFWVAAIAFGTGTVLAMMLYGNISKRKWEAQSTVLRIVDITEETIDAAEWGKNFPRQYDGYIRTAENEGARFKWSDGRPPDDEVHAGVSGTAGDPQGKKAASKLESDPRLKTIFNGYAFAIDYRERRGHAFMLNDQRETDRVTQRPQPLHLDSSIFIMFRFMLRTPFSQFVLTSLLYYNERVKSVSEDT